MYCWFLLVYQKDLSETYQTALKNYTNQRGLADQTLAKATTQLDSTVLHN